MTQEEKYMKEAIRQAKKAYALDEVPIGCVIVQDGKIIARGYNRRNTDKNTLAHAELTAIRKASRKTGDWRLEDCTMYVTLEPCQMCAGAIVQSRMKKVVIASMNPKAGCAGSVLNLLQMAAFNHQVEITRGVLEETCSNMLKDFFAELRVLFVQRDIRTPKGCFRCRGHTCSTAADDSNSDCTHVVTRSAFAVFGIDIVFVPDRLELFKGFRNVLLFFLGDCDDQRVDDGQRCDIGVDKRCHIGTRDQQMIGT